MLRKTILCCFVLFTSVYYTQAQAIYRDIKNYTVYYASAKRNTQDWLAIRRFESQGKTYLLLVEPRRLDTKVDEAYLYTLSTFTLPQARKYFGGTAYEKAINKAETQSKSIQDAGIQSGIRYSAEGDHVIPWQTEHVFGWRTSAANAVLAFQS